MRVDTGYDSGDGQDPVARLKGYLVALRRRWWLVPVLAVLGASLGWLSAPAGITVTKAGVPTATVSYYRASFVLAADPPATDSSGQQNSQPVDLNRAAFLVNTGEVPKRVAAQLKLPLDEVRESLLGLPRTQVTSVEVQAFATDQGRAEALADAAATNLQDVLKVQAGIDATSARNDLQAQIDSTSDQIAALNDRIGPDPSQEPQLSSQLSSLNEELARLSQQQGDLGPAPVPTSGLSVLQTARSTRISKDDYNAAKKVIRDGADYVTGAPVTIPFDQGSSPTTPSAGASASTRAAVGGILGVAIGVGLILLFDRFDSRLRRRDGVEAATGLTVVGEVPPLDKTQQAERQVVAHIQHRSRAAEAYRVVRGALLYAMALTEDNRGAEGNGSAPPAPREGATVVMVTSASPSEGKTTTVANLAAVMAEGGMRVLVINCDFRRPLIQRYLLHDGTNDAHDDEATTSRFTKTEIDGVRLVTGIGENDSEVNPLDVVAIQRRVIEAARPRFDVILLDTAPFLTTNDASELFDEIDHLLLVVRAGKTRADAARRAAEILTRFEVPVVGVVLNDSNESAVSQYYYDYGYSSRGGRADKADLEPASS